MVNKDKIDGSENKSLEKSGNQIVKILVRSNG